MESKDWITAGLAAYGALLSTIIAVYGIRHARKRLEVMVYTYDLAENIGLTDYMRTNCLPNLAIRVINHSEYPLEVRSVGLRVKRHWYRPCQLVALSCPAIRRKRTNPDLRFKVALNSDPEPELEYENVRIEPRSTRIFEIDAQENGRADELALAVGVYVRLADDSIYRSPGLLRTPVSAKVRKCRTHFFAYCQRAIEQNKRAERSLALLKSQHTRESVEEK